MSRADIRILTPADYARVPWKNGGGVSVTIAGERLPGAAAGDWSGVVWQLGRTSIVAPGPFSDLTGFERLQTVVKGEGLFLDTPRGPIDLSRPLTVARYDGGTPIVSRLAHGPVEVVNLIARRDAARITMAALRAGDGVTAGEGTHVIYACDGAVRLRLDDDIVDIPDDHAAIAAGPAAISCETGTVVAASIRTGSG
ncbi:MAG: HutD/Ves family protein [Beijerinckiaceae bacterium]